MASKSVNNEVTEIDPMFYIPEGYVGLVRSDSETHLDDPLVDTTGGGYIDDFDDTYAVDEYDDTQDALPAAPDILALVNQYMIVGAAGDVSVTIELEVEELPGEYEFRIAPA